MQYPGCARLCLQHTGDVGAFEARDIDAPACIRARDGRLPHRQVAGRAAEGTRAAGDQRAAARRNDVGGEAGERALTCGRTKAKECYHNIMPGQQHVFTTDTLHMSRI